MQALIRFAVVIAQGAALAHVPAVVRTQISPTFRTLREEELDRVATNRP